MRRFYILLSIIGAISIISIQAFAATVGNPLDLDVPAQSAILRQEAVKNTLDECEQMLKIKASLDLEFVFDKDLRAPVEIGAPEMKGRWYMAKLSTTIFNRVEPYIKIGTSDLQVKWRQAGDIIEVEADSALAWGAGVKGIIWEFEDWWDVRLTGDFQYRTTEPDTGQITKAGSTINDPGADFEVDEWQAALILSKKFELPLKWQNIYIVPYTGITLSDSKVDVKFTDPSNPAADYSLFDASNESTCGFILGCDIMPNLRDFFIYSIELRLINELALTLGGTMKF